MGIIGRIVFVAASWSRGLNYIGFTLYDMEGNDIIWDPIKITEVKL